MLFLACRRSIVLLHRIERNKVRRLGDLACDLGFRVLIILFPLAYEVGILSDRYLLFMALDMKCYWE